MTNGGFMRTSYFNLLLLPIALLFAIVAGCGNNNQLSEPVTNGQGIALLKISAAAGTPFQKLAKKATLTISATDMLTMTKTLSITDSSVEGAITGIPSGKSRLFTVAVFDSLDTLQYRGSSTADVIADSTVKISINVIRVSGNAIINGTIIDTVTDIDGNVYHPVTIGTQVWMVENLKTTRYIDGTPIPLVTDEGAWAALSSPAYCWYDNDSASYKKTYGALYNWAAVNTGKQVAPVGWHIATDEEWSALTSYLGGDSVAGTKLKEADTTHWASPNWATNISGFSALPGGGRTNGSFGNIGRCGYWWTYATGDGSSSWSRGMINNGAYISRDFINKKCGLSVRCVKDNPAPPSPSITTQPISQTVTAGQSVTFSVTAAGTGSLSYQWYKNDAAISGATSWVYSLSNVQAADSGTYTVTVSNGTLPNAISSAAMLTVAPLTVTDKDGNVYQTVKIGNQIWTVENLRTTKYNDGSSIPLVTDSAAWAALTTPGFCYYNNSPNTDSIKKFGALYNWYAVNTQKLAPAGWHVPSNVEWEALRTYLTANGFNWDGTTDFDKAAKSLAAKEIWFPCTAAGAIGNDLTKNNKTGFSALPGGFREFMSIFIFHDFYGAWWSTTESDALTARFYLLRFDYDFILNLTNFKCCGFSVRLLKD
jgi:uncharacterized protein (TIGR02145 family)